MNIQKRKANVKRHTTAWKIGGKWRTRSQAYKLATEGKIEDVIASKIGDVRYIRSLPGKSRLYDLPMSVV